MVMVMIFLALIILAFTYSSEPTYFAGFLPTAALSPEELTIDLSEFPNADENQKCLQCHGQSKYTYENTEQGKMVNKRMYTELIISPNDFYISNHKTFKCTDCHSEEYHVFPHSGQLRMEYQYACIDCHGEDENYTRYHFEEIDTAFMESVHSQKLNDEFTCWMCHNPHTYKINARTNKNIRETIVYDNMICLDCHSDYRRFQLLTDRERPNLIRSHDWLPNQELHIASVRCIECHTVKQSDSTLVEHNILPKDKAVKKCRECHSTNPELLASLYKYEAEELRGAVGFIQGITTGDSVVIGASRNRTLNILSLILFAGVVAGIGFHLVLRVVKK
jgi:Zn finger protein HypA/HybF involved in hydrogenase expression